jgi:hypothetical protein
MIRIAGREFTSETFEEVRANHAAVEHLTDLLSARTTTERNNAVAVADYLAAH